MVQNLCGFTYYRKADREKSGITKLYSGFCRIIFICLGKIFCLSINHHGRSFPEVSVFTIGDRFLSMLIP
ncbi:hypothetical protein ACE1B6_03920 [Aerosakkonemataceae cyanobacterium BLCC-F154]|uniref:Uncharacterized protein n=1 Tax=Floridaenema fluviatile BLCC-F154 TaxID=3153640 RepID=A0ABV4Y7A1_9CYAN